MSWRRRILYLFIVLGVVAGLPDLRARLLAEGANRSVEIVADQASFTSLAASERQVPESVFAALKRAGVGALGVTDDTLASLAGQGLVGVFSGQQWAAARCAFGAADGPPLPANPQGTYVWTTNRALAGWLTGALRRALGSASAVRLLTMSGVPAQFVVAAPSIAAARAMDMPLGFSPLAFRTAAALGLRAVVMPAVPPLGLTEAQVSTLFRRLARAGVPIDAVELPDGVPNYPAGLSATASAMRVDHLLLGVVETPEQLGNLNPPGTAALSGALSDRTVRIYDVPWWTLARFAKAPTADGQAVSSVVAGVAERNLRLVYLTPVVGGADPLGQSLALCRYIVAQLRARGFTFGPARPFPAIRVGAAQRVVQGLATVAGGLLLLEFLVPDIRRFGFQPLVVLGGLVTLAAAASAKDSAMLIAFGAACSFGGLASYYAAGLWTWAGAPPRAATFGAVWLRGVRSAAAGAAITFCGALIIATVLGDTAHLLEWQYYRGVKVTYLAIPFLAALSFLRVVGLGGRPSLARLRWTAARLLAQPWRVRLLYALKYGGIALIAGVAFVVYLHRSGNVAATGMLTIELRMREALAHALVYRPREKEFLVGYPSILLATFFAVRRQRWPFLAFLLGFSVAAVSLVDTFAHIRTPFAYSWWREWIGFTAGICTATAALAVFHYGERLTARFRLPSLAEPAPAGGAPSPPGTPVGGADGGARGGSAPAASEGAPRAPRRARPEMEGGGQGGGHAGAAMGGRAGKGGAVGASDLKTLARQPRMTGDHEGDPGSAGW